MDMTSRRKILRTVTAIGSIGLAGCSSDTSQESPSDNPQNEQQTSVAPWRGFGGDTRHSWSRTGANAITGPLSESWSITTESAVPGVAGVVDGRIYATTGQVVSAIDASTGDIIWEQEIDEGGAGWPTVANGKVYTGTNERTVRGLSTTDGSVEWSVEIPAGYSQLPGVTVVDGTVYLLRGALLGYDTNDEEENFYANTPLTPGSGVPPVSDGFAYIYTADAVHQVTLSDKNTPWRYDGNSFNNVAIGDGQVYLCEGGEETVIAVDEANGEEQWSFETNNPLPSPTIGDGTIYAVSGDMDVLGIDADSGEEEWRYEAADEFVGPTLFGDTLYGSTEEGIIGLDASTGDSRFVHTLDSESTLPVVSDGRLYVGVGDTVRAYEPENSDSHD